MAETFDIGGTVDYGVGTNLYGFGSELNFTTINQASGDVMDSGGGSSTATTVAPMVSSTTSTTAISQQTNSNYTTFLSPTNYIINVFSNIKDALIHIDDVNTFKTTPNQIQISTNNLPLDINRGKVVTVKKEGYDSFEKYIFYLERNPNFSNITNNGSVNYGFSSGVYGVYGYQPVYSSEKYYKIKIEYYKNDTLQSYPYAQNEQIQTIGFNLTAKKINPIEDTPDVTTTPNTFLVNLSGPDKSVDIQNGTKVITLKSGENKIEYSLGDEITIKSSNINSFRITNIDASSTTSRIAPLEAKVNESLATTIKLNGQYSFSIKSLEVNLSSTQLPEIQILTESGKKYNINSKAGVPISIKRNQSVEKVSLFIGEKKFTFTDFNSDTIIILIPHSSFGTIGKYKAILLPSNSKGDGDVKEVDINVVDESYVGVPDLRNIKYPSILRGPDYVGTNVDFEISWESVNTDYVRIFNGGSTSYTQVNKTDKVKLNVQQLLNLGNQTATENDKIISFSLRLVPYNASGFEIVEGKTEKINITFQKGDLVVPRNLVINRFVEAFTSQFDDSIFEDETSKYLTHLLHLGDGNNKVITTWTGSLDTLIVKLYEPIPTSVQLNQQVWISKIQSNPIIETITISGEDFQYCPPLKGPNFNLVADNGIGYKVFDDLIASGSVTSNDLILKYSESNNIDTTKLNISYVSGSEFSFENFSHFGSAEERIKNFFYKVQLIENYETKYNEVTSGSSWILSTNVLKESERLLQKINGVKKTFDGFENFLYSDTSSSLSYPKTNGDLLPTTNATVTSWYDSSVSSASEYDKYNVNYLVNNLPEHIREDYNNEDFILFLDMVGQHFDVIWSYINGINKTKLVEDKKLNGIANNMVYHLLASLGWEGKRAFDSQFLWEYAFGKYKDGTKKYDRPLEDANNEVWRRILNNLPYLLKHKGTGRAMKAIMACYGVPQSMLTIMEFGGPQDPSKNGTTKFTFDDRTAAIQMKASSSILVPWKQTGVLNEYPNGIEFRIKPDLVKDTKIINFGNTELNIIHISGSYISLDLNLGNTGLEEPYITASFTSASVTTVYYSDPLYPEYVNAPQTSTASLGFPLSTENYTNILLNKYQYDAGSSLYELLFATSDGQRITTYVSMSLFANDTPWEAGNLITIGNDFSGALDEFRLWRIPLQPSKFQNHALHPDSIAGNSYTASTEDLLFRLDFEYPKDRTKTENYGIKNVAINTTYGELYASASNFYSASAYPYQYIPYDRTVTATVPSMGLNYSNKIRFEEQQLVSDLSYKTRATKKSFDQSPIDSNRLGLFFSPIKELNMDIVKAFGDFNIDNYIGDPADEYKENYKELENLREYYFQRLDRNIYEYINLVRYIDKSLFEVLSDLAPARAKISKGLLIEPHYLERSKVRWDKPTSVRGDYDGKIGVSDNNDIESSYEVKNAFVSATNDTLLNVELPNYDTEINNEDLYNLEATNPNYDSLINYDTTNALEATTPFYGADIECPTGEKVTAEVDSFQLQQIGMEKDSLANLGFGLYAANGNGLVRKWDGIFGNQETTGSRQSIFLVKEQYKQKISTQVSGYPVNGSQLGDQVIYEDVQVTKYKYKISTLPFSGSVTIGNDVVSVTSLNGYFPTHYRYTNNLGEGMIRSFWKGSVQSSTTTPDGLNAVETFSTNPNILRVAKTGRGSGEPILEVD